MDTCSKTAYVCCVATVKDNCFHKSHTVLKTKVFENGGWMMLAHSNFGLPYC